MISFLFSGTSVQCLLPGPASAGQTPLCEMSVSGHVSLGWGRGGGGGRYQLVPLGHNSHMCCSPGCLASDPAFPVPTTGPPDVSLHPQGSLSPCPALKPWMPPLPAPHSPQPSLHPHRQAPLLAMVSPPPCLHSCPQGDQRGGLNPLPLVCVAELPGLLQLQTTQPTLTG